MLFDFVQEMVEDCSIETHSESSWPVFRAQGKRWQVCIADARVAGTSSVGVCAVYVQVVAPSPVKCAQDSQSQVHCTGTFQLQETGERSGKIFQQTQSSYQSTLFETLLPNIGPALPFMKTVNVLKSIVEQILEHGGSIENVLFL